MSEDFEEKAVSIEDLWSAYQKKRNPKIREKLIENYLPLVNIVAARTAAGLPGHVERDDLISSGFFGLLDAIERYDPVRGNKFETYAGIRIRGAVLDYLRSKDWIPVSLRQKIRRYETTLGELEAKLGRSASDEEVAAELGVAPKELQTVLGQLSVATILPLDEYIQSETVSGKMQNPSAHLEMLETQEALSKAIDRLPEKERMVVSLYYYDEMTLKEISLILHLSEARISQLHTKAIFRLRGFLSRVKTSLI